MNPLIVVVWASMVAKSSQLICQEDLRLPGTVCLLQFLMYCIYVASVLYLCKPQTYIIIVHFMILNVPYKRVYENLIKTLLMHLCLRHRIH